MKTYLQSLVDLKKRQKQEGKKKFKAWAEKQEALIGPEESINFLTEIVNGKNRSR